MNRIALRGLRVGKGSADLEFRRTDEGAEVDVLQTSGQLTVEAGGWFGHPAMAKTFRQPAVPATRFA
ncbi:hypothetical protein [Mesorhizobium argentiipisi]|uniref:Uncharacterized protein n=1 Tax=Mesorhizobium argentiipisi TaxID=3015175 RepID=A0ABU8K9N2_9HYPH